MYTCIDINTNVIIYAPRGIMVIPRAEARRHRISASPSTHADGTKVEIASPTPSRCVNREEPPPACVLDQEKMSFVSKRWRSLFHQRDNTFFFFFPIKKRPYHSRPRANITIDQSKHFFFTGHIYT